MSTSYPPLPRLPVTAPVANVDEVEVISNGVAGSRDVSEGVRRSASRIVAPVTVGNANRERAEVGADASEKVRPMG